jgi:ubiquitin-conjugating enzyme (huntingtin interacting protein 2)
MDDERRKIFDVKVVDIEDIRHLKAKMIGPQKTAYQGGIFIVDVVVPLEYPIKPPIIKFDTKIWHPNINSKNGTVHLDMLTHEWSPTLTIKTALKTLHSLLE